MMRSTLPLIGAVALVFGWTAGDVLADEPKRGGTLRFAVSAEPPNYDCHENTSFAFIHAVRPHYNTLLKFDEPNYPKVKGDLAQSWDVAADGPVVANVVVKELGTLG
jgi:peptide/nickel transport system substrate-binding protein